VPGLSAQGKNAFFAWSGGLYEKEQRMVAISAPNSRFQLSFKSEVALM
jgi:hypothetical protein